MEPKQNYLLVGLFVLLSVIGIFTFVVWLSGSGDKRSYTFYRTYVTDSVTGLGTGAAVKYRGVDVGKVTDIAIDTKDRIRVQITMRIVDGTPITQDTVAVLKLLGITGVAYVELEGGSQNSPPLTAADGAFPTIASRPSELSQLMETAPELMDRASHLLDQLSRIASDENAKRISATLANIEAMSNSLGDRSGDLQKTLRQTAKAMEEMTKLLDSTNQFSQTGYRETGALLNEMKNTVREIHELVRDIRENPSKVVIPNKKGGVAIP